ncbi:MAG: von Willebrand factor type A domain-containing protein, partial [Verrucomicrobiota bacterium]
MSDSSFSNDTPTGHDQFVDAALSELGRLGSSDDEAFLAGVEAQLPAKKSPSITRARIITLLATAACLVLGTIAAKRLIFQPNAEELVTIPHQETPPENTPPIIPGPSSSEIASAHIIRLQERVKQSDLAAIRGSQLYANGDIEGALDQYSIAIELLPEAPMTEQRRDAYIKQYTRAANKMARQYADGGRYPEAIALIEEVLVPSIDPYNTSARQLLSQLNDPSYYNPALTPANLERLRRVRAALVKAEGHLAYGDTERAEREFILTMNNDRYNSAARRGMEHNERLRMNYYDATYNHSGSKFLREGAESWEHPVPEQIAIDSFDLMERIQPVESESYDGRPDNLFRSPIDHPLSTFSVDVDTASYTNLRRLITNNHPVPADAVRIEEMMNYFEYDYAPPVDEHPFSFPTHLVKCPWNPEHRLLRVGLQGRDMPKHDRPAMNLVFLLDVSGSMASPEKLPLVRKSLELLVEELREDDTLSIVVYAGAEGLALPPTSGADSEAILKSLDALESGGSTNGGAGIKLAYQIAKNGFKPNGTNRVILCTDGDFNVGLTDQETLADLVQAKAKDGTYLSVLGFGAGNLNDSLLEAISNDGNGNYFYIDSLKEARRVLLQKLTGTLVTIAKDVKIQIEFNPKFVENYRLIGYTNRQLKSEDFENDEIDAGEIGAGHSVTALYEIIPDGIGYGGRSATWSRAIFEHI